MKKLVHSFDNSGGDIDSIDSVDLATARMKCISTQWIVQMYNHFCTSPDILVNGFKAIARASEPVLNIVVADGSHTSMSDAETDDSNDDHDSILSVYFSSDDEHRVWSTPGIYHQYIIFFVVFLAWSLEHCIKSVL